MLAPYHRKTDSGLLAVGLSQLAPGVLQLRGLSFRLEGKMGWFWGKPKSITLNADGGVTERIAILNRLRVAFKALGIDADPAGMTHEESIVLLAEKMVEMKEGK